MTRLGLELRTSLLVSPHIFVHETSAHDVSALLAYSFAPEQVPMVPAASGYPAMSNYHILQLNGGPSTVDLMYGPAPAVPAQFDYSLLRDVTQAGQALHQQQTISNGPTALNSPDSNATNSSANSPYSSPETDHEAADPETMLGLAHNARTLLNVCKAIAREDVKRALETPEFLSNRMLSPSVVESLCHITARSASPGKGGRGSRRPILTYTCKICLKKTTENRRTIEDHVNSHFGLKPLKCSVPDWCVSSLIICH
jgi:hypothetical protein